MVDIQKRITSLRVSKHFNAFAISGGNLVKIALPKLAPRKAKSGAGNSAKPVRRRSSQALNEKTGSTTSLHESGAAAGLYWPEQARIQTEVLGHSLIRSLVRSHCSLICSGLLALLTPMFVRQ